MDASLRIHSPIFHYPYDHTVNTTVFSDVTSHKLFDLYKVHFTVRISNSDKITQY